MSVHNLIDAIAAGDSVAIETSFQQEMAARIADRMDTMRAEVAKNMFASEELATESIEVDETVVDEVVDVVEEDGTASE